MKRINNAQSTRQNCIWWKPVLPLVFGVTLAIALPGDKRTPMVTQAHASVHDFHLQQTVAVQDNNPD